MKEVIISLLFFCIILFSYFSIYKIIVSVYREKLDKKFFSVVIMLSSLFFPISLIIFLSYGNIIHDYNIIFYFYVILFANIIVRYIIITYDIVVYTVLFYSLFIINHHYEIANNFYMSMFILVIIGLVPFIRSNLFSFELVLDSGGNLDYDEKKRIVGNFVNIKDKNGNRILFDTYINEKFGSDKDKIEKHLDSIIFDVYKEKINKNLFCFHIIMSLLTVYFLLSQI